MDGRDGRYDLRIQRLDAGGGVGVQGDQQELVEFFESRASLHVGELVPKTESQRQRRRDRLQELKQVRVKSWHSRRLIAYLVIDLGQRLRGKGDFVGTPPGDHASQHSPHVALERTF